MTERLGPATNGPAGPAPDASPAAEPPADGAPASASPVEKSGAGGSPEREAPAAPSEGGAEDGAESASASEASQLSEPPRASEPSEPFGPSEPADEPSVPRQARRIGHVCEPGTLGSRAAIGIAFGVGAAMRDMRQPLGTERDADLDPAKCPDPLEHPDPGAAADAAGVENLLRCWVRESGTPRPPGAHLRLALDATGTTLRVPVRYWSATGCHRFGPPVLEEAPEGAPPVDAVTLAALLHREAASGAGATEASPEGSAELIGRVANSVRCTAAILADRRARPGGPHGDRFLEGEQSLILGHPLHPTPKSREGLSEGELRAYSPELRGSFPLHWLAVHRSVLAADSAWTARGRTVPPGRLAAGLAGDGLELPADTVPLPLHPWQAREVRHRPEVAALLDAGLLQDLGPHGPHWHPTSSVRTVHCPGAEAMLKLSLGLRITNSRRENLRKELQRGVEVHRLLRSGLAAQWRAAHPGFDIVRDPAWLAVTGSDGEPVRGLDVVFRHNPFGPDDDAVCVAGLTSPRPWPGQEGLRSRLADLLGTLTARTGRPAGAVAAEWFLRYLHAVVRPVLWLDGTAGVALEAHQQNTLVLIDADGWPSGGRYRDNQGYYFRESRRAELDRRLPGIGVESDTFVPDDVTDERFAYYLGINNVLGLIGAFGAQGLADEDVLLAAFRRFLTGAAAEPAAHRSPLPERLLSARTLRCKANLLTRLHGLDELVGPVDTQSVYVTLPNPLNP